MITTATLPTPGHITPRLSWPRPPSENTLTPRWAGEFVTFDDWVNFATTRLTGTRDPLMGGEVGSICVDALGRRCTMGGHFMRARDEGAFPVRYFFDCAPDIEPSLAIRDVIAERYRQTSEEGFTPAADDGYAPGTLSGAAACYVIHATETQLDGQFAPCCPPPLWPWAREWWKPNGVRRALVKAAALIIAEIEKIDRKAARGEHGVEVAP